MSQIDTITVRGFKSINIIDELKLQSVNVLIGANGSGKSNFVGVFAFVNAMREGRLQDYVTQVGGADKLLFFGSKTTKSIYIKLSFEAGTNQYDITLEPTSDDELIPTSEAAYFWSKSYPRPYSYPLSRIGKEAGISALNPRGIPRHVREHLGSWRIYHFHDTSLSSPMKKTNDVNDNRYLRPDGSNLAAFLYLLRNKHEQSYTLIRHTVQHFAPFFDDFILEPQELNKEKITLAWRHKGSDAYFSASSFSDGTLRFIALATLFLQPEQYRPSVILIDEPELGLHPYGIEILASLVRQISVKTQVILSTQSSLLLDQFQAEDVLVASLVENGTQFTRLESDKLKTWLQDYSLGQLWEKNELGGRPKG